MKTSFKTFGRRFYNEAMRRIRLLSGITETQLAHAVYNYEGSSPTLIQAIENGRRGVSLQTLIKICKVLSCSVDEIAPRIECEASVPPAAGLRQMPSARAAYFRKGFG